MRSILLNPGPVSLSEKVRKAAVRANLCHREPEFFALQDRVRSDLIDVYRLHPSQWTSVLLGGSGTMALDQALLELKEQGGWMARHARYHKLADRVGRALERYGVETMLEPGESSCVLRSYRLPQDRTYQDIHDGLKQRGFVIYAGQGSLAAEMFRISTMGDITNYDMERLLAALADVFG